MSYGIYHLVIGERVPKGIDCFMRRKNIRPQANVSLATRKRTTKCSEKP